MICENCNIEYDKKYGSGRFCCKKCASSFSTKSKRKEINSKVSLKLKGNTFNKGKKQSKEHIAKRMASFDEKLRNQISEKIKTTKLQIYLEKSFDELGPSQKRRRVFEEQNFKCNNCSLDEWLGQKIKLELEHKDGDTKNNVRFNLEGLCPNCHSFTPTWRKKKSVGSPNGRRQQS